MGLSGGPSGVQSKLGAISAKRGLIKQLRRSPGTDCCLAQIRATTTNQDNNQADHDEDLLAHVRQVCPQRSPQAGPARGMMMTSVPLQGSEGLAAAWRLGSSSATWHLAHIGSYWFNARRRLVKKNDFAKCQDGPSFVTHKLLEAEIRDLGHQWPK